ncbi:MAG: tetratricopeptide repeat protein [Polyangiaceae bacterium]|jgi:TolA-binding protein
MSDDQCWSDLLQRARRSPLSRADRLRLEPHLAKCASCRFDLQVFGAFDAEGGVRPGDDALDLRLADHLVKGAPPKARAFARRSAWAAAAACFLLASGALASVVRTHGLWKAVAPSGEAGVAAARLPAGALAAPGRATGRDSSLSSEPSPVLGLDEPLPMTTAAPERTAERPSHAVARRHAVSASVATTALSTTAPAETESAGSLFERANGERRRHQVAAAISLYSELQSHYPQSREARISHVSLGRLLLRSESWLEALSQFDAYLSVDDDEPLKPEALFGKARALEALGRREEARGAWARLQTGFKDSVYASEARQRLDGP